MISVTINDQNFVAHGVTNFEQASGVSVTTGVEYRIVGATMNQFTASTSTGRLETTYVNTFLVIGPGPDNNFLLFDHFHITITPEGEVTVNHFEVRTTCQ